MSANSYNRSKVIIFMKQKKKFLYVTLPIVILGIFAFGYKYYYCDMVTDYLQVTYYPQMVKLYSINWGYGREYYDPEVKVSIKSYENDSIAFSTEYPALSAPAIVWILSLNCLLNSCSFPIAFSSIHSFMYKNHNGNRRIAGSIDS